MFIKGRIFGIEEEVKCAECGGRIENREHVMVQIDEHSMDSRVIHFPCGSVGKDT